VLLIFTMVNLGFWQLRRLDERRDHNALIEGREDEPVVPSRTWCARATTRTWWCEARFRTVTGDRDLRRRRHRRDPQPHPGRRGRRGMMTPLVLGSGDRVGIVRGFVPLGANGDPPPHGAARRHGHRHRCGGRSHQVRRHPRPRTSTTSPRSRRCCRRCAARQSDPREPDALTDSTEDPSTAIAKVSPPELGEGPHLSYAVQWFIFSTIALVGTR
jgi:cytochrome oxidase assembly protein ShyY1